MFKVLRSMLKEFCSFCSSECWLSSRTFRTLRPSAPEVRGLVLVAIAARKALHSAFRGSSQMPFRSMATLSALLGTGRPFCQSIVWG